RRGRRTPATYVLRAVVVAYLVLLVAWPVTLVGLNTFDGGWDNLSSILGDPDVRHALRLTATAAVWAVALNTVFGLAISLLLVRYEFPGKRVLSAFIDLPLSVSPIVVGLSLILVYSSRTGWFAPALNEAGIEVLFATPGIVLATAFVS